MGTKVQRCRTKVKSDHVDFEWTIDNFGLLEDWEGVVESEVFGTEDQNQQWTLQLYPTGKDSECKDWVALFLAPQSLKALNIKIMFKLYIVKSNKIVGAQVPYAYTYRELVDIAGSRYFIDRASLLSLTRDDGDTITICCTIDIPAKLYVEPIVSSANKTLSLDADDEDQLVEDFGALLKESAHSDVTIIVRNEKFTAHKIILASRSSAFAAMFRENEMNEIVKSEVKIEDMAPAVVQAMLEFIYTNKVTNLEPLVNGLLMASNKYDLHRLKVMCSEALYNKLNVENAAEILVLADAYNAKKLKDDVLQFIVENSVGVLDSEGYKKMEKTLLTYPTLLMEVMRAFALQNKTET